MYYDSSAEQLMVCRQVSLGSYQWRAVGGGGFTNMQVFDTAGTFEVPSGVTKVMVEVWGGGGGGGGACMYEHPVGGYSGGSGGSGGGGAYGRGILDISPGSYYVRVGRGGSGKNGCGENGEDGGESSFGGDLISAGGGGGGESSPPTACCGNLGEGGISGAAENISGESGHWDKGGVSPKGGVGGYVDWERTLLSYGAQLPGGGGTGSERWSGPTSGGINATDGARGRVIVWW